jgi:hypothetical protein
MDSGWGLGFFTSSEETTMSKSPVRPFCASTSSMVLLRLVATARRNSGCNFQQKILESRGHDHILDERGIIHLQPVRIGFLKMGRFPENMLHGIGPVAMCT